jgi:hypothetical protein
MELDGVVSKWIIKPSVLYIDSPSGIFCCLSCEERVVKLLRINFVSDKSVSIIQSEIYNRVRYSYVLISTAGADIGHHTSIVSLYTEIKILISPLVSDIV